MISVRRSFRTSWIAKAVLWLGLFGFALGWANACLAHEPLQGVGGMEQQAAAPAHAPHGPGDADSHACNAALDDCQSLCNAQQNLLPKSEPPRGLDGAAWLPAIPAFAVAWAVDRAPAQRPPQTRTSPPRLAVVLRFLRLTL